MLNVDKYREAIMSESEIEMECNIAALRGVEVVSCANLCDVCRTRSLRWLFCEYEPPILENLKPGDWIMVRDTDIWRKRQFIGYFDGLFYAKNPLYNNSAAGWPQARLPMEGE